MILTKEHWEKDKAQVFKDLDVIKRKIGKFGTPVFKIRSEYLESLEILRELFSEEMKKATDKWWAPFPAIGLSEGVEFEWGEPLKLADMGTGFRLSGVIADEILYDEPEPECIIQLNVKDHIGTSVDLENCEVKIVDVINGIIEIKKYKKVEIK